MTLENQGKILINFRFQQIVHIGFINNQPKIEVYRDSQIFIEKPSNQHIYSWYGRKYKYECRTYAYECEYKYKIYCDDIHTFLNFGLLL
jgi:hypothetical protein